MDLIPIPVRPDIKIPDLKDQQALEAFLKTLADDYNKLYGILRQDINRLGAPELPAKEEQPGLIGHGLARDDASGGPLNLTACAFKKDLQLANGTDRGKVNITFKYLGIGPVIIGSGANVTYTADLAVGPDESGGTITYSGAYTVHTFNASGTFTVGTQRTTDILVVAGGGGGGGNVGGGGGAGGYQYVTSVTANVGANTITVGGGGGGGTGGGGNGAAGGDSVALGTTSKGGGAGRGFNDVAPAVGGSGGGGSGDNDPGIAGTAGQGNDGGSGTNSGGNYGGGGGGGASAVGTNATSTQGGPGGAGTSSSAFGAATTRAGGGGGGGFVAPAVAGGAGGAGGGGAGNANNNGAGVAGTANTGGGGGGGAGGGSGVGGAGGSGVVLIRYLSTPGSPNGLDTGSEAANTWYYVYMIAGLLDTEVFDPATVLQPALHRTSVKVASLLSTSATPKLPPGFSWYRRVGMVRNNGSSDLYRFNNAVDDDLFWWNENVAAGDFLVLSVTTSAVTFTDVSCAAVVPPTSREIAMNVYTNDTVATLAMVKNKDGTNVTYNALLAQVGVPSGIGASQCVVGCDSSQVIQYRADVTTNDTQLAVKGYKDIR